MRTRVRVSPLLPRALTPDGRITTHADLAADHAHCSFLLPCTFETIWQVADSQNNNSEMAELGDEDLVDYEEDDALDSKPADDVKK